MASVAQAQAFGDIRLEGQGNSLTINQVVQISVSAVKTQTLNPQSPYLGLRRFDSSSQHLFFGRDQLVARLMQLLAARPLTLVAGASGSGKSSVVRAGLIPQLHARLPGGRFRVLALVPDRDPFESLRICLISAGFSQREAEVARPATAETLLRICQNLRPPEEQWLLFIDQFEEIFTLCNDPARRAAFIDGLVRLAESAPPEVRVIMTLRADFFDHFGPYPRLAQLIPSGLMLVGDMHADELRQVIEQPAAHHGVVFEEGLVEEIIHDIKGEAGALPLLEYTLDLLWASDNPVDDRTLNTRSYRLLGGVRGALKERAEALYDYSDAQKKTPRGEHEQETLRHIFLRLIDLMAADAHARAVSKRAPQSDFQSAIEQKLIAELVDAKLLVTNRAAGHATLEIAHEALISGWPRLADWIAEGREILFTRNRLSIDTHTWIRTLAADPKRAEDELWSGTRLQHALELNERGDFHSLLGGLTVQEDGFLRVSAARLRGLSQLESHRRRKFRRADRLRSQLQTSVIILASMTLWCILLLNFGMRAQQYLLAAIIEEIQTLHKLQSGITPPR